MCKRDVERARNRNRPITCSVKDEENQLDHLSTTCDGRFVMGTNASGGRRVEYSCGGVPEWEGLVSRARPYEMRLPVNVRGRGSHQPTLSFDNRDVISSNL